MAGLLQKPCWVLHRTYQLTHCLTGINQPVWFTMPEVKFPHERKVLGWWLSLYEASTDTMAYCILAKSGKVVVRKSVWGITNNKMVLPATMDILALLDAGIKSKVGNTILEKNLNDEFKVKQPDLTDYIFDEDEVIDLVELELT
jgi:hypothetical protein